MTIAQCTFILSLAALTASCFPIALFAETTVINNIVKVNSSSGGNFVSSGEVVTGTLKNSVSVQTSINGEIVENYSHTTEEESVNYERTTTVKAGSVQTSVQASTSAASSTSTPNTVAQAKAWASTTKSSTLTAKATTTTRVSFISNLLTKIFSYVTFWTFVR
jgi:hypothetical protein